MNQSTEAEQEVNGQNRKPLIVVVIFTVLAFLSPIGIQITVYGMTHTVLVMSFLYGCGFTESYTFFRAITPEHIQTALILMFPRFASVVQMHRYYEGKSDRRFSLLAAVGSESTGFLLVLPSLISTISFPYIVIPLPLIILCSIIFLWGFPRPEPQTPWKETTDPERWLGEDSEQ